MAHWVARCRDCGYEHTHSTISDSGSLADFYLQMKPDMLNTAGAFDCPNCKAKRSYVRSDLMFRA
jgi:predicted Zn-ribbon and HTH transcriptional regulator